nr:DNA methyltransferase [Duganella vulcania]
MQLGDVYIKGSPAKSTYIHELIVDLKRRLGLFYMNTITWRSNKPPGPIAWSAKKRIQCHDAAEYCIWFSNDPEHCIANNQRELEPHTEKHLQLIARGGENRTAINGDGAYRIKPGSYGKPTAGRIMRNVLEISNVCASQRAYKRRAKELGLVPHGATMPLALARKLVRFLSDVGQLCVDPLGGSLTTGLACELEGRPWIATDVVFDYIRGAAERFTEFEGFELALDVL